MFTFVDNESATAQYVLLWFDKRKETELLESVYDFERNSVWRTNRGNVFILCRGYVEGGSCITVIKWLGWRGLEKLILYLSILFSPVCRWLDRRKCDSWLFCFIGTNKPPINYWIVPTVLFLLWRSVFEDVIFLQSCGIIWTTKCGI